MAAKKRFHGMYEGMENRRHQEMMDGGMIREDKSEVANMPQSVMYKPWPGHSYGMLDSDLDDTISGINKQIDKDDSQGKRGMNPHKY